MKTVCAWLPVLLGFTLIGCGTPARPEPILIGHLLPDDPAEAELHGIALAVDERNADPEQRLLERPLVALHAEAHTLADFESQTVRLEAINRVQLLIGGATGSRSERIRHGIQADQTLFLSLAGWSGSPYHATVFHLGTPPRVQGQRLGEYAIETLPKARMVALIDGRDGACAERYEGFRLACGRTVPMISYGSTESRPDLLKQVANEQPQVLLFAGSADDFIEFRQLWPNSGFAKDVVILYAGDETDGVRLREVPAASDGMLMTTTFLADRESPSVRDFVTSYEKKYQVKPNALAALSYEAVQVWATTVAKLKTLEIKKVRDEWLRGETFTGITGSLRFTKAHHVERTLFLVRLTAGQPAFVKVWEPTISSEK